MFSNRYLPARKARLCPLFYPNPQTLSNPARLPQPFVPHQRASPGLIKTVVPARAGRKRGWLWLMGVPQGYGYAGEIVWRDPSADLNMCALSAAEVARWASSANSTAFLPYRSSLLMGGIATSDNPVDGPPIRLGC